MPMPSPDSPVKKSVFGNLGVSLMSFIQGSVERLTQEKVDLEASLEMEEEAFINNLVRQLSGFMQNYQAMDRVWILIDHMYSMCPSGSHNLLCVLQLVVRTGYTGLRLLRCEQHGRGTSASLHELTCPSHMLQCCVRHGNMGNLTSVDCCCQCEASM